MRELPEKLDALIGRGRWDEAEKLLLEARDRARERRDEALTLSLCSELMGLYRMYGRERGFRSAMEEAVMLLGEVRIDRRSRGTILINAATGLAAFGRAEEALPLYREAEAIFHAVLRSGDPLLAALYNNMSAALRALGDLSGAERYLLRAEQSFRDTPHHPDLATTRVNLAQLYALGDSAEEKTRAVLDRAWEIFDDPETVWDGYYAHTALKCAGAFEELGQSDRAAELRERAELIYEGT